MNDYKQEATSSTFNTSSLSRLANLINQAELFCKNQTKANRLELISISDTIVLFTPCDENSESSNYETLKLHSKACSWMLNNSAKEGFAIRGAVTIGEYAYLRNIVLGPGVDECASWYEQTDWLGVIFAPSAQFIIDQHRSQEGDPDTEWWDDEKIVYYKDIPVKNGFRGIKYCVSWGEEPTILNKIMENTVSLSRDIAVKHINTNKFLYKIRGNPRGDK